VLLNVTENLELAANQEDVWRLLRNTERLAALVPGVQSVQRLQSPEREAYHIHLMERVGPFKVKMQIEAGITEAIDSTLLGATVRGGDPEKKSRATGAVRVELSPSAAGTSMNFVVNMEILGKLATLGAPVMKRRVNELFSEFGRRVTAEFAAGQA
jgi:uncharacterized protein